MMVETARPTERSARVEELLACVARGEFVSVRRDLERLDPSEREEVRAELAIWGEGPVLDILLAAGRARREGRPDSGRLAAAAARGLARLGANALANSTLDGASECREVEQARQQIGVRQWHGSSARGLAAARCAANGNLDGFVRGLQAVAEHEADATIERTCALVSLAGISLSRRDFAQGAERFAQAVALARAADKALSLQLKEALCQWAACEMATANVRLSALSRRTATETTRTVVATAADLHRQLDLTSPTSLAWQFCEYDVPVALPGIAGVVAASSAAFGVTSTVDPERVSSMGPGCAALAKDGLLTLRLGATPALVAAALGEGAIVAIEEERPAEQGFRFVLGVEPVTGMWLLRDGDSHEAEIVPGREQERRSSLVSMSAVVIVGVGEEGAARVKRLAGRQVVADPVFAWLDACEEGEDGRPTPAAEVRRLVERVRQVRPNHPLAIKRLGEELSSDDDREDAFLKWYADASEQFPRAEWVWQIYARFLDRKRRYAESGIAWAEASRLDPLDARNAFGRAHSLSEMGRTKESEPFLRQTVALAPGHMAAYSWLAAAALERRDFEGAGAAADLWRALDTEDSLEPLIFLANVAEERRDHEAARGRLEQARALDTSSPHIGRRLAWHMVRGGRWQEARSLLESFIAPSGALEGASPAVVADLIALAARAAWASGEAEAGVGLVLDGMRRIGPKSELVDACVRILTTSLATPEREREVLVDLCDEMANEADGWGNLLAELCHGGHHDKVEQVLVEMSTKFEKVEGRLWLEARTRLQLGQVVPSRALLEQYFANGFEWETARTFLALSHLSDDPRGALDLVKPRGGGSLAAQWMIALSALESLGEHDRASGLRERLAGLPPDDVVDGGRMLRLGGRPDLSRSIVTLGLATHPDAPSLWVEQLRSLVLLNCVREALPVVRRLVQHEISVPDLTLAAVLRAEAWDDLVPIADVSMRALRDHLDDDGWPLRAILAVAELRQGRGQARLELLRLCPSHPAVVAMLARLERGLGLPAADEDDARLARLAPGLCRNPGTEILL